MCGFSRGRVDMKILKVRSGGSDTDFRFQFNAYLYRFEKLVFFSINIAHLSIHILISVYLSIFLFINIVHTCTHIHILPRINLFIHTLQ